MLSTRSITIAEGFENVTPAVENVDCDIVVSELDIDPVAESERAAWFTPLPVNPHSNTVRVEDQGAQRTQAEAVKAALPDGSLRVEKVADN